MSALRTQPQGRVSVTRDRIGRGIIAAYSASPAPFDPVSGLYFTSSAALSSLYNPAGRVAQRNSTNVIHLDGFRTSIGTGDFSVIGYGICRSNNTQQNILTTRPNGSVTSIEFGWSSLGVRLNVFGGTLTSSSSGHTPGALECVIAVRRAGVVYLYVNGNLVGSGTNTSNVGTGNGLGIDGGGQSEINMAAVANRAWTDFEIAALSYNPWQLFDAGSSNSTYQSAIAYPDASAASVLDLGTASATSNSVAGATLTTGVNLAASDTSGAAASGALTSSVNLSASSSSTSSSGAALSAAVNLSASSTSTPSASGALSTGVNLAAGGTSTSAATGALSTGATWSASSTGTSAAGAALNTAINLGASGTSASGAAGTLTAPGSAWTASASSAGAATATLTTAQQLAAQAIAAAQSSAALATGVNLAAGSTTKASASGSLVTVGAAWAASSTSGCGAAAALTASIRMAAAAASAARAGALLPSGPTIPVQSGNVLELTAANRILELAAENRVLELAAENRILEL